jgi:hypothetical protein
MTSVIINWVLVGTGLVMGAATIVFMCHGISSEVIFISA